MSVSVALYERLWLWWEKLAPALTVHHSSLSLSFSLSTCSSLSVFNRPLPSDFPTVASLWTRHIYTVACKSGSRYTLRTLNTDIKEKLYEFSIQQKKKMFNADSDVFFIVLFWSSLMLYEVCLCLPVLLAVNTCLVICCVPPLIVCLSSLVGELNIKRH